MINLAHLADLQPASQTRRVIRRGTFTLALQRSLRRESFSWPLFCLLLAVAEQPRSFSGAAVVNESSYHRIYSLWESNPHLFLRTDPAGATPVLLSLSPEGEAILSRILLRATDLLQPPAS